MKTTIHLDDRLIAQARQAAALRHSNVQAVLEDALRLWLAHQQPEMPPPAPRLHTVGGNGPRPGANLNSNAQLFDFMDASE